MTTFTTEDREEAEKKDNCDENLIPVPFFGYIDINVNNDDKKIEIKKTFEF
jgi:hypothetical protein